MQILVAYESRTGRTAKAAAAIADVCREADHEVTLRQMLDVTFDDLDACHLLVLGTWVRGLIVAGVRPHIDDSVIRTWPGLDGKLAAVFCTYAVDPRRSIPMLRRFLEERGAVVVATQAFRRGEAVGRAREFTGYALAEAAAEASRRRAWAAPPTERLPAP